MMILFAPAVLSFLVMGIIITSDTVNLGRWRDDLPVEEEESMRLTRYPVPPEAVAPEVAHNLIASIDALDEPLVPPMAEIQYIMRKQADEVESPDRH